MKYNHVGFNAEWASSISEEAFIAHESHSGLSKAQLSEAYQLMKKAKGNEGKLVKLIEKTDTKAEISADVPAGPSAFTGDSASALPDLTKGDPGMTAAATTITPKPAASGNDQTKTGKAAGIQSKGSGGNSTKGNK